MTVGLSKTFPGGIHAVESLDLTVAAGEIFGLLGPNGAGKTTTVGMLSTRVVPTSGNACVGGVDVVADPALAKQAIGVVAQSNTLDRSLDRVGEPLLPLPLLRLARALRGRGPTSCSSSSAWPTAPRPMSTLCRAAWRSASWWRAASSHRPHILFLDEPTAGLDPQSRLALWAILRELHGDGLTVLLTTHYMEEADQLCDRVAIMDHGRILALDTPAGLKASVGADTIALVATTGDPAALAARLSESLGTAPAAKSSTVSSPSPQGRRRRRAAHRGAGRGRRLTSHRPLGQRAHPRDRVHHPDRQGAARMSAVANLETRRACGLRPARAAGLTAFWALLLRDLRVLQKTIVVFAIRTVMQPLLLVFVFTYVFPKIGQGVGGSAQSEASFSTLLMAGRGRHVDDLSGRAGGRPAARAGVRLHARDRRSRDGAACRCGAWRSRKSWPAPCRP